LYHRYYVSQIVGINNTLMQVIYDAQIQKTAVVFNSVSILDAWHQCIVESKKVLCALVLGGLIK
jgi:hypothetical protein